MATEIDDTFGRLRGLMCWGVHWDADTGLRLNFGEPHLVVQEPRAQKPGQPVRPGTIYHYTYVEGDWVFWIGCAYWKLTYPDIPPVTGTSSYRRIMMAEFRLDGQRLVSGLVNGRTGATRMVFDIGTTLDIRRSGCNDADLWELRTPERTYLTVSGNGFYTFSDGQTIEPPAMPIGGKKRVTSY